MLFGSAAQDLVVPGEGSLHRLRASLPKLGGALYVGEQEGDCARGQIGHWLSGFSFPHLHSKASVARSYTARLYRIGTTRTPTLLCEGGHSASRAHKVGQLHHKSFCLGSIETCNNTMIDR